MKREFSWNLKVDGTRHEVLARDKGNAFDIYVDEEFRFTLRSDINLDIEEDLTVGTKRCRIVVYRGVPDLAVDGILLDADAKLVRQEKLTRFFTLLGGVCLILLGTFAMGNWMALTLGGQEYFGGILAPLFSALIFGGGIWVIVRALRKRGY